MTHQYWLCSFCVLPSQPTQVRSHRKSVLQLRHRCAQVLWVQPRVLTLPQIEGLMGRLDTWISKVSSAAMALEEESVGVVET